MGESLNNMLDNYPDVQGFLRHIREGSQSRTFFRQGEPLLLNRTPGRLDLMGGNDDYTGGMVFESTIREATIVAVQPRQDKKIRFLNPAVAELGWQHLVEFSLDDLVSGGVVRPLAEVRSWINADPARSWCAYILGDVYFLAQRFFEKLAHGFDLYLESDVPLGKGVSSSAALEVAPMKAIAEMYGIQVGGVELAAWTQWVEIALTESACGIMDQVAVIMGEQDAFVPMLCQPSQVYPLARLPQNLRIWGVDSGVRHAVSGSEYESARAATFMGYRYLCDWEGLTVHLDESGAVKRWVDPRWNGYLANLTPSLFRARFEERLPEQISGAQFSLKYADHYDPYTKVRPELNYPVRAAVRYAVEENWRVQTFYQIISAGRQIDASGCALLGELMYLAHEGYSQCGLGSTATDRIVELVRQQKGRGLLGAKITGGGAGGTVAVLGRQTPEAQQAFEQVVRDYRQWSGRDPYIFTGSSAGCDRFGVVRIDQGSTPV